MKLFSTVNFRGKVDVWKILNRCALILCIKMEKLVPMTTMRPYNYTTGCLLMLLPK